MSITLTQALSQLDPSNDEHWTNNGAPAMSAIHALTDNPSHTRANVTEAAPQLMRTNAPELADPEAAQKAQALFDAKAAAQKATADTEAIAAEQKAKADAEAEAEKVDPPADKTEAEVEAAAEAEKLEPSKAETQIPAVAAPPTEIEQIEAERDALGVEMVEAQKAADAAKLLAAELADKVNHLNRRLEHLHKADPNYATRGVRAYLAQQHQNRIDRAAGLHAFIKVAGIHPKDVATAIDPRAGIDRALSARKTPRPSMHRRG